MRLYPLFDPNIAPVDEDGNPLFLTERDMEPCLHQYIAYEGPDESVGIFGEEWFCEDCGETDVEILFEGRDPHYEDDRRIAEYEARMQQDARDLDRGEYPY